MTSASAGSWSSASHRLDGLRRVQQPYPQWLGTRPCVHQKPCCLVLKRMCTCFYDSVCLQASESMLCTRGAGRARRLKAADAPRSWREHREKGRSMTTHAPPHSTFLTVNGLRLHILDWGNAGIPTVVCVHGYTSSAEAFNAPARYFQDRFHFITPDVRGHGESAWSPTGAYQYSAHVSDLEGLVTQLGLERFTLIGTSMGGIIAMAYAGAHHERLARLVINDIGPDAEVWGA